MWFAIFPTYETLIAQGIAGVLVVGSYFAARRMGAPPDDAITPEPEPAIVRRLETVP
jgi:hypothetical protein